MLLLTDLFLKIIAGRDAENQHKTTFIMEILFAGILSLKNWKLARMTSRYCEVVKTEIFRVSSAQFV